MNTDPLTAVAKAVRADVGCVAEVVRDQLFVTDRIGDRGLPPVWPLGPAATEALRTGSVIAPAQVPAVDLPMALWGRAGTPIAWVPLPSGFGPTSDLLIMLRPGEPYGPADLELLAAGAPRIGSVLEAQERGRAIERLAKAGPDLARYIDLDPLLDEAVILFRELTATDSAFIVTIDEGIFELAAYTGIDASIPRRWPRTFATMPNWEQLSAGHPYVGQREIIPDRPHETHGSPTVLCVPVMRDGVAVALLGATGHRARSFGKTGVDVATILANHLSVAMQNAELYRALSEREQELQHRAAHDPLTGLANRVAASHQIEEGLARSPASAVGLMFCDVDKFKAVSARLGHRGPAAGSVGPLRRGRVRRHRRRRPRPDRSGRGRPADADEPGRSDPAPR
jgi:GAF domain-containing protein